MRRPGASPARLDAALAGVRLVMTRCARALQRTNAGGAATWIPPRNRWRCARQPTLDDVALSDMAKDRRWARVASTGRRRATCLAATPAGLLVGTARAHLLRLAGHPLPAGSGSGQAQGGE